MQTTETGEVKGKLAYMAPEQMTAAEVDRRADLFAAATLLWEGLANRRLFDGDGPAQIVGNVLSLPILPPSGDDALDQVAQKRLARHREERFATAREMAIALEEACAPATPRAVESWLRAVAVEPLPARDALLAEMESGSSRGVNLPAELLPDDANGVHAFEPRAGAAEDTLSATESSLAPPWRRRGARTRAPARSCGVRRGGAARGLRVDAVRRGRGARGRSDDDHQRDRLDVVAGLERDDGGRARGAGDSGDHERRRGRRGGSSPARARQLGTGARSSRPGGEEARLRQPLQRQRRRHSRAAPGALLTAESSRRGVRLVVGVTAVAVVVSVFIAAPRRARADDKAVCFTSYVEAQRAREGVHLCEAASELTRCGSSVCPGAVRDDCVRWYSEVQAATASLVVSFTDAEGKDRSDTALGVDGEVRETSLDGRGLAVDPGAHRLVITTPRGEAYSTRVLVREGERDRRVTVQAPPRFAPAAQSPRPVPPLAWTLGGVGLAGLATWGGFGLAALYAHPGLETTLPACKPSCASSDVSTVHTRFVVADVAAGIGLLSLDGAAFVFFTRPHVRDGASETTGWRWQPDRDSFARWSF
jgi:hypothetical protein